MLNHDRLVELSERFVWNDVLGLEARHCQGWGWSQSLQIAANQLRIWSDPQPDFFRYGEHGLDAISVASGACLLTRQYCNGYRADFTVAASLKQVVDLLLLVGSNKIGVAADALLVKLEKERKLMRMQVIGHV